MGLKQLLIDQGDTFRQRLLTPDYTAPGDSNIAPLVFKELPRVNEDPNSGEGVIGGLIDSISEGFIPGGGTLAFERAKDDTQRITKFLLTGDGISFVAKEAAIQRTNPQSLISPTNRTRLPLNLLAQIPLAGTGTHVRRDGGLDTTFESNFNYDPEKRGGKKYDKEYKDIKEADKANNTRENEFDSDHTLLGILNKSLNSQNLIIKEYSGGAGSVFGVAGTTQIQRYEHVLKRDHTSYPKSISKARQREKLRVTTQRYGLGNPDEPAKRQVNGYYVVNQQKSRDEINISGIFARENLELPASENLKDYIRFKIALVDTSDPLKDEVLLFRAFLNSINDSFTGDWNSFKYNGRAENFYTYNGFDRDISFSFQVAPQTGVELKPLYDKLNYFVGSTAPVYKERRMRGRYARLSIGNWCNEIPGFFKSINLAWTSRYPWEINYLGPEVPSENDVISQHPLLLDVSCTFKPIHDYTPESRTDVPFIIPKRKPIITDKPPDVAPIESLPPESFDLPTAERNVVGGTQELNFDQDVQYETDTPKSTEHPMNVQFARVYSATTPGGGDGGTTDYGTFSDESQIPSVQNLTAAGYDQQTGLSPTQRHLQSLDYMEGQADDSSTSGNDVTAVTDTDTGEGANAPRPGFASDITLKENIKFVGKSPSGINIYEFNYINKINGSGRYRGVMAQEVPYASTLGSDGKLRVFYDMIDVDFEQIS